MTAIKPWLCLVLAAWLLPAVAQAASISCAPAASWSQTEAWVWSNLCTGYVADLTTQDNAQLSMTGPVPWPADRTISAAFLEDLLTNPKYALKLSAGPMIIAGARVTGPVIIADAALGNELILSSSRFDGGLDIEDSTSSKGLFLTHDVFGGDVVIKHSAFQLFEQHTSSEPGLNLSGDKFSDDVLLESTAIPNTVYLTASTIGAGGLTIQSAHGIDSQFGEMAIVDTAIDGSTVISNAHFTGPFDGSRATFKSGFDIAASSFARGALFQDTDFARTVDIERSSFGDDLRFDTSKFESAFALDQVDLCLDKAKCELFLVDASFGNKVSIGRSLINGDVNADGATASSSFELTNDGNAQYPLGVKLMDASFARDLTIGATVLAYVQAPNASVDGALQLLLTKGAWAKNSWLALEGTTIGVLTNPNWVWPDTMFLEGMHFGLIGQKLVNLDQGCVDGGWSHWLGGMQSYSPEPYQQLAKYLTDSGNASAASCVLETGEQRSLGGQMGIVRKTVYWAYGKVAGYGYAPEQAFPYVVLFVLIGMLVLRLTGQGRKHGMPIGLVYSFSQLIPLVSLDKRFDDVELTGPARYYFYLHKIVGYVIAIFIAAALTSLSSKG